MLRYCLLLLPFITHFSFAQPWLDKLSKAEAHYGKHQYLKSLALAEEGHELWKKSPDTTLQSRLYIYGVLELIYESTGFYGKAENIYYKELAALNASGRNLKKLVDAMKLKLADLYIGQGRFDQADFYIQDLVANSNSETSATSKYQYRKFNGNIRFYLGDLEAAEKIYNELLAEERVKHPGDDGPEAAALMQNIAFVYDKMKRYKESDSLYRAALKVTIEQSELYSTILNNLGSLYLHTNRLDEAEDALTRVVRLKEKQVTINHPEYGIALNNLALVYKAKGNAAKARQNFQQSLAVASKAYKAKGDDYMNVLGHLAELEASEKNYTEADKLFVELLDLKVDYINNVFSFLSEKEKSDFYFSTQDSFNKFRKYAVERSATNPKILDELINLQLKTKGWLFTQQAQIRHALATTTDPQLIANYQQWRDKKLMQVKSLKDPLFTDDDRKTLEKEIVDLEKKISSLTKTQQKSTSWNDIQKLLKPDEAGVEVLLITDEGNAGRYGALVFNATDTSPRFIDIGTASDLEGRNFRFYQNSIMQRTKDENSYNVYWQKVAAALPGINKVFISSDGIYQKVNLITLLNPISQKYLVDELTLIHLTNLQEINAEVVTITKREAMLIGYPDYNLADTVDARPSNIPADSLKRFFDGSGPALLPGTLKEVEEAKALLESKGVKSTIFSHENATEQQLKSVQSPTILHIATHGFFLNSNFDDMAMLTGVSSNFVRQNPMIRSGILLAGSGSYLREKKSANEDGIHTAFEASNLDLNATRIVVLSACETGLGEVKNGEGVYGLQRAFSVAGAKSVLMSLWKVDDNATRELMVNFYRNWQLTDSPVNAFYKAVKSSKDKYTHPYYWGAFVLSGL